jgi:DNA (cytosine-5)-methyltransferase 1
VKGKTYRNRKVYAVDLFCGAGGLTKGLGQAGIDVKLGVDADAACEYPYIANNSARFLKKPVEVLEAGELEEAFPKNGIRVLAGCAPCQTFSKYNQKANPEDGRWWLLQHFSRLILQIGPELVTMENVPGIAKQNVFQSFVGDLKCAQYEVDYRIVNCADYGIPQQRSRLVLLASRFGPIRLLTPKELRARPCSVRDAIGHLPPITAGEVCKGDRMHQSSMLSAINLRRIRSSRPGGTWRDWRGDIVANCHKRSTGRSYPSVYGRMDWDEPAPTITTQFYGFGNGRFGHPEQDRAISLREGAILQSFPNNYVFAPKNEPILKKTIGRLVGNAVPVKLGRAIGKSILYHIMDLGPSARCQQCEH